MSKLNKIGFLDDKVIKLLQIDNSKLGDRNIYLKSSRKKHMEKHRNEFNDFESTYNRIDEIIMNPDYVGIHPNGKSIEYIKIIEKTTLVAVRLDKKLTVRTMFPITKEKLQLYLKSGSTKKY